MAEVGGVLTDWQHGLQATPSVLTDFTSAMISVEPSWSADDVDSTTFGTTGYRSFEQSFKEGEISATYIYSDTDYTRLAAIFDNGTTVDFQWSPAGTASGKPKDTGSMVLMEFSTPTDVGELQTIETTWKVSGAPTRSTHGA